MSRVIISLTSYPGRIHIVHKVIESLICQESKADEIVLWLSEEEFPDRSADLPAELLALEEKNGFHIKWVKENLKSHKKYFYALQEYKDCVVITVDDDRYYARNMVGSLLMSYGRHPYSVSARNVHRILRTDRNIAPYALWEQRKAKYADAERLDLCAIGVGGILYPPGCASEKWFDLESIQSYAENQDDLWLKYNEVRDGIPVVYVGVKEGDREVENSQNTFLSQENVLEGGNDRCIRDLSASLSTNEKGILENWVNQLESIEKYIQERESTCRIKLEEIFESNENTRIYICGAGKYARILFGFLCKMNKGDRIEGFLVSEKNEAEEIEGIRILDIKDLDDKEPLAVLCGVNAVHEQEIKELLLKNKQCKWLDTEIQELADSVRMSEYLGTQR